MPDPGGVLTGHGRAVNKPRGSGYAVRIWLENDGDVATQPEAFERQGISAGKRQAEAAEIEPHKPLSAGSEVLSSFYRPVLAEELYDF